MCCSPTCCKKMLLSGPTGTLPLVGWMVRISHDKWIPSSRWRASESGEATFSSQISQIPFDTFPAIKSSFTESQEVAAWIESLIVSNVVEKLVPTAEANLGSEE